MQAASSVYGDCQKGEVNNERNAKRDAMSPPEFAGTIIISGAMRILNKSAWCASFNIKQLQMSHKFIFGRQGWILSYKRMYTGCTVY